MPPHLGSLAPLLTSAVCFRRKQKQQRMTLDAQLPLAACTPIRGPEKSGRAPVSYSSRVVILFENLRMVISCLYRSRLEFHPTHTTADPIA